MDHTWTGVGVSSSPRDPRWRIPGEGEGSIEISVQLFQCNFWPKNNKSVYLPTQSHKSKCQSYMYICVIETHRHINRMKVYYLNASFLWSALPTPMYGLLCPIYCCAIILYSATLLWPCLVSQSFILFVTLLCLIRLIS